MVQFRHTAIVIYGHAKIPRSQNAGGQDHRLGYRGGFPGGQHQVCRRGSERQRPAPGSICRQKDLILQGTNGRRDAAVGNREYQRDSLTRRGTRWTDNVPNRQIRRGNQGDRGGKRQVIALVRFRNVQGAVGRHPHIKGAKRLQGQLDMLRNSEGCSGGQIIGKRRTGKDVGTGTRGVGGQEKLVGPRALRGGIARVLDGKSHRNGLSQGRIRRR